MDYSKFAKPVLAWYDQHGRKTLPWKLDATPYHVWISEVMLQQTQVTTVIPYYEKFIARFPNVNTLAEAKLDDVLKHWTGLGYYTRARNLYKAAQVIVDHYNAALPDTVDALMQLPGIGRSTAGAIVSLGYGKTAPICDGNVKRVLGRYFAIDGWPGQSHVMQRYWHAAEQVTPPHRCADFNQAMMDIGSMVCVRTKPKCHACPLHIDCKALKQNAIEHYPTKKPKSTQKRRVEHCVILVLESKDQYLFVQRPASGIWGGLWCLPMFDDEVELTHYLANRQISLTQTMLTPISHQFSHFTLNIQPILVKANTCQQVQSDDTIYWAASPTQLLGGTCKPVLSIFNALKELL